MAALFSKVSDQYGQLVNFIIRPPRDNYSDEDLGPKVFTLAGKMYQRTDLELINRRNMRLQCSHYGPVLPAGVTKELPCVVYLHGNCSSRVEALSALPVLLPQNITVFAFDFSGSGRSDGPYISLGWWERDDLDTVIEHLRSLGTVSAVGLWGRSMGAVTALMHAHRDPSIGGMVLDSPFAALRRLAEELADVVMQFTVPKFLISILLSMVRNSITSKAQFDINLIAPINHVGEAYIPALFVCGKGDTFISPQHVKDLHAAYRGDKNLVEVEGGHNSPRPAFMLHSAAIFFRNTLNPTALTKGDTGRDSSIRDRAALARCRDTGDSRDTDENGESANGSSSSVSSDLSFADLVIPVHPFEEGYEHIDATAVAAAAAATAAAAAANAAAAAAVPNIQQQQAADAKPPTPVHSEAAAGLNGSSSSSSSSSKRKPWHSIGSSSKNPTNAQLAETREAPHPPQRRGSLLARGLLRWSSASRSSSSSSSSSSSGKTGQSQEVCSGPRGAPPQLQHTVETVTPAGAAGAAAAEDAAAAATAPTDVVRGMVPPVPSFCFLTGKVGLQPVAFVEDDDEILKRAISISLEEFIRECQADAEAAGRDFKTSPQQTP